MSSIISVKPTNFYKDKNWILDNEGDIYGASGTNVVFGSSPSSLSPGNTILSAAATVNTGMFARVDEIIISADGACYCTVTARKSNTYIGANLERVYVPNAIIFGAGGGQLSFPTRLYIDEGGHINFSFQALATGIPPQVAYGVNGMEACADGNFNAKYSYLQIGDSRSYTQLGTNPTTSLANWGAYAYSRRLVQKLRNVGKDIRLVQKGVSGIKASQYATYILTGALDTMIREASVIEIELGINDAAAGTAASTSFSNNYQQILDYCIAINPTATYILEGLHGTSVSATQTNAPGYRTILASLPGLSKYSTNHLYYWDSFSALGNPSAANDTNWTETALGSQLHPRGDTGHLTLYNSLFTLMQTTYFYTNS